MGNTVQLCPHLYKLAIKQRVDTKMKNSVIIFSQVMQAFSCTTEAEGDLFWNVEMTGNKKITWLHTSHQA